MLTLEDQKLLSENSEKMMRIIWKMLILDPPLLPYQPLKYDEDMHRRHYQSWIVKRGHFDLVYYSPVIIHADSKEVACEGYVGNKKPINYIDSSDSEEEEFQQACKGQLIIYHVLITINYTDEAEEIIAKNPEESGKWKKVESGASHSCSQEIIQVGSLCMLCQNIISLLVYMQHKHMF